MSLNLGLSSCRQGLNLQKKKLPFRWKSCSTIYPSEQLHTDGLFMYRFFKVIYWHFLYEKVHFDIAFPPLFFLSLEK